MLRMNLKTRWLPHPGHLLKKGKKGIVARRVVTSPLKTNSALFDAVGVGLACRLQKGPITDSKGLVEAYNMLLKNDDFRNLITGPTSDEKNVFLRLDCAINAFVDLK